MSEYRVAYAEVPAQCQDNETYSGLLLYVRPQVQLNPDAVTRYLSFSDFEPINPNQNWEKHDIKDVVVLGSTPEQTTIYASIVKKYGDEVLAHQAATNIVKLLHFMGAQAIIEHSPTPDA